MAPITIEKAKRRRAQAVVVVAAVAVLILVLTAGNYNFSANNPGGSDFVPRWLGTRLLMREGISPYSDEATFAIQEFYYGQPASPQQDQVMFVYPLYSAFLFAPFSLLSNFVLARALWMTALELAILASAAIGLRLAWMRLRSPHLAGLMLFSLLWYHSLRPLINGNAAILSGFFIAAGLLSIRDGRDRAGGFLLALASIKPQIVVLLYLFVLLWAWVQRRKDLIASLAISLILLIGVTLLVIPDWISHNLEQVLAYPGYTLSGTPAEIFADWWPGYGRIAAAALTAIVAVVLAIQWARTVRHSGQLFVATAYFTLAATNLIGIRTTTANYFALLPGVILVAAAMASRWRVPGQRLALATFVILFFGLWLLFLATRSGRMQNPLLFFPLPVFLVIALPALLSSRSIVLRRG